MGKENNMLCDYLDDRERFADLFNGSFFNGRQVVKPDDLVESSGIYTGKKASGNDTFYRARDLKKQLKNGIGLKVVLAVEAQNYIDYSMPWRIMDYDAHEYESQLRRIRQRNRLAGRYKGRGEFLGKVKKTDLLAPVYTLCLYNGAENWDGPRTLRDMMNFGKDRELWEDWFADYPVRLVCMNEWKDCNLFRTPLRELFRMLPYRRDKAGLFGLLEQYPEYSKLDKDTADILGQLMGVDNFVKNMEKYKEEETYNMCQALRELMEDSRNEGLKTGLRLGKREGMAEGLAQARTEDILEILNQTGRIPRKLQTQIRNERDLEVLMRWLKTAAQATTIDEFKRKM